MPLTGEGWMLTALDMVEEGCRETRDLFPRLSKTYVPGEGAEENAQAFIIGEAPGATEDMQRRPFVGKAGQILRQLMDIAGLWSTDSNCDPSKPANCWLTNVVKFRPPGNSKPTAVEIGAFRRFLQEEWVTVGKPRLIIPVGGVALMAVTGKPLSILRAAGKCHTYQSSMSPQPLHIWPMVHPSFVMRQGNNETLQALIEADWDRLRKWRVKNS